MKMEPQTEHRKPGRPPGPRKESFVVEALSDEQIEVARRICQQPGTIEILRGELSPVQIIQMLKEVLLEVRVRTVAGYKRERCLACNHPHTVVPCRCPHHAAAAYLRSVGVEMPDL